MAGAEYDEHNGRGQAASAVRAIGRVGPRWRWVVAGLLLVGLIAGAALLLRGEGSDDGGAAEASATTTLPSSPALDGVLVVAQTSTRDVVELHGLSAAAARPNAAAEGLANNGRRLAASLEAAGSRLTAGDETLGSVGMGVGKALLQYAALSKEIEAALRAGGGLPADFGGRLEDTEQQWRTAMQALGAAAGTDLLAELPPLLAPEPGPTTTVG